MRDTALRIVIVEDETLIRRGLELLLADVGHEVAASLADAALLCDAVARYEPDLVVTDIRMPPTHTDEGLVAALAVRAAHPATGVVVLSQHVQRSYAHLLLGPDAGSAGGATGGVGYLLKQRIADIDTFVRDLAVVAAGGTVLDPDVVAVMVDRARRSTSAVRSLTPRQQEVLALVAEGQSNAAIAAALFLTEKAVVQHMSRIYDALGLCVDADGHRRVQAVVRYLDDA
ncbi:response regulator transcription factor [Microbacterium sp. zg.Y1090]|uniref:response regulator transcription factor n=1 Tax=Microbacterium wangruii TaxID=3049073 RepID=UPI00214D86FA|nr:MULTISPECIES: response regulator transcription factor [unclassified Microbacterium]MCR2819210.1 response regulator transcription factor [Microbacterium sp. zg.Y1090]WIM28194.1 response regulator transcription factor [Microbacterium sp. zg-Y1090]